MLTLLVVAPLIVLLSHRRHRLGKITLAKRRVFEPSEPLVSQNYVDDNLMYLDANNSKETDESLNVRRALDDLSLLEL